MVAELLCLHAVDVASGKANVIQVAHMCNALGRLGGTVKLAIPTASRRTVAAEIATASLERQLGCPLEFDVLPYRRIGWKGRPQMLGGYLGIKALLRDQPEQGLCLTRYPAFARAACGAGRRVIFEAHDRRLHPGSRWLDTFYRNQLLRLSLAPSFVRFVAISEALARFWIAAGVPPSKVLVLHDGVSEEAFALPADPASVRSSLGLAAHRPLVTYTGSLYPDRGIEVVLELAAAFPRAAFLVVGGPEARRIDLEAQASARGLSNVLFAGPVSHARIPGYLFASDVLLMLWTSRTPTIDVCSPLKLFEYMASGRPIVGIGFPTIHEVLENGIDALLAPPDDVRALTGLLGQALESPMEDMGARARSKALKHYTWSRRAAALVEGLEWP